MTSAESRNINAPSPRSTEPVKGIIPLDRFVAGFQPPAYLVDGFAQLGRLYSLTAKTGHGKTATAILLAICVAKGWQFCGREVEQGRVLMLAGENPEDVKMRFLAACETWQLDPVELPIDVVEGHRVISEMLPGWRQDCSTEYALVVVDTTSAYFEGDNENDNIQMLKHARLLRGLTGLPGSPCVFTLSHPTKNASRDAMEPKGGSQFVNEIDGNATLRAEGRTATVHWFRKWRGPDFEPMRVEFETVTSERLVDAKGRQIPSVVAKPVFELREGELAEQQTRTEDRALAAFRENPALTVRELAEQLGISRSYTGRLRQQLIEKKWLRPRGRKMVLTAEGEAVLDG